MSKFESQYEGLFFVFRAPYTNLFLDQNQLPTYPISFSMFNQNMFLNSEF